MYKRRLIIGGIIGIFTFTILTWIDRASWQSLEAQVLDGRSYFNFVNPNSRLTKDIVFLSFDKKAKRLLVANTEKEREVETSTEEQQQIDLEEAADRLMPEEEITLNSSFGKDFLLGILKSFDEFNVKGAAVIVDELDKEITDELEIEAELGDLRTPIAITSKYNTEHQLLNNKIYYTKSQTGFAYKLYKKLNPEARKNLKEAGTQLWINKSNFPIKEQYSLADFLTDQIPKEKLNHKLIVINSEFDKPDLLQNELNIYANYSLNRWLNYIPLHPAVTFLLIVPIALLFVMLVYWARIFVFLGLSLSVLVLGQLLFTAFNTYIETLPIILGTMMIFLLSSIVDLNLMASYLKEKLRSQPLQDIIIDPNSKKTASTKAKKAAHKNPFNNLATSKPSTEENIATTSTTSPSIPNSNQDLKHLKRKFYCEQEDNLEAVALELQEKSVKAILGIQEKLDELRASEALNKEDRLSLDLIKYDFNKTIDEFDHLLFNLVPFQFEAEKGLINSLEILAEKTSYLSKNKVRVKVESELESLNLDPDIKINTYRIIQKLLEVIKNKTEESRTVSIEISTPFAEQSSVNKSNAVKFKVVYDGFALDPEELNFKLRETNKRASAIGAQLSFTSKTESNTLTNKIELDLKPAAVS